MMITEEAFDSLKKPVRRVATKDMVIPSGPLEEYILPSSEEITSAIRELLD
jgi:pyruvate/2-oxoglutarate/acetoin dehydrogenase E1 component